MKLKTVLCIAAASVALLPTLSEAKGCLKGAAVGGIGGHVAGHHALIGAAAGCAIGHHMANKQTAPVTHVATPTQPPVRSAPAPVSKTSTQS